MWGDIRRIFATGAIGIPVEWCFLLNQVSHHLVKRRTPETAEWNIA
jgi:hypothetical protein